MKRRIRGWRCGEWRCRRRGGGSDDALLAGLEHHVVDGHAVTWTYTSPRKARRKVKS